MSVYLMDQAIKNPGPFMSLLGKVLPMQHTGANDGPIKSETPSDTELAKLLCAVFHRAKLT